MAVGTTVSITGLIVTNLTMTGTSDQLITESGLENTIPPVREAYNPRHEITLEGIDDGYATSATISAFNKNFAVTSLEKKRTLGDVVKYSVRGIHYPGI